MASGAKIKGDKELAAKLAKMITAIKPERLKGAVNAGLLLISNDAKIRVPVLTGNLQRSITTEVSASGGAVTGRVGTNVEYAETVEFGYGRQPKPYLRPALDNQKKAAVKEIGDALVVIVRNSAK